MKAYTSGFKLEYDPLHDLHGQSSNSKQFIFSLKALGDLITLGSSDINLQIWGPSNLKEFSQKLIVLTSGR